MSWIPTPDYVAGLFDGEGTICISVSHRKPSYTQHLLSIRLVNTYLPVLMEIQRRYGGHVRLKDGTKHVYEWYLYKDQTKFLSMVYKHLKIKRDQATLALLFRQHMDDHVNGYNLTEPKKEFRVWCYNKMRELNHRRYLGNEYKEDG